MRPAFNVIANARCGAGSAERRLLDAFRLRAAVLSEPRRGRSAVRPRRVRREGHSRRAGRGRRTAAPRGRVARRPGVRRRRRARQRRRADRERGGARHGVAVPDQRRADRQPARPGDARHSSAEAPRQRPRGAFVVSGARRIGDRQADRRADSRCGRLRCRPIRCSARRTTPSG